MPDGPTMTEDRMAVLPQWAVAELVRLRDERDEARAERDRARDSACLYEQIIERIGGTHIFGRPFYPGVWVSNDMRDQGSYVVEGPR